MAVSIEAAIRLQDFLSAPLRDIQTAIENTTNSFANFSDVVAASLNQAVIAANELNAAIEEIEIPTNVLPSDMINDTSVEVDVAPLIEQPPVVDVPIEANAPNPLIEQPPAVDVPVNWISDNLEVFTNTGIERFEQEIQSANNMLSVLTQTQNQIASNAAQAQIFPTNAVSDLENMQNRIQAIQDKIHMIENNPINMGTDIANNELERLRSQLDRAVQEQQNLNNAVSDMDIQEANAAYLRLSNIIGNTERYIRDNTNSQGEFNQAIEDGSNAASDLRNMLSCAIEAFIDMFGIGDIFSFINDCIDTFNEQVNSETQLMSILANMLDEDYVSQFEIETTADTTEAINEIDSIQNSIDDVTVNVSAESRALQAEFDKITAKAAEIESKGIYGADAMTAAAAEFATYFSDADAITAMMDTLSDYAMGMAGVGEIDTAEMVNYATNLGEIMSGAYDAMTEKGFKFTEAQKAIIDGEATREQIVDALGTEYLDMSEDMQAAAAITAIIDESWSDLYETMSNTPQGKIIQLNNALGNMKGVIGEQLCPYAILFVDIIAGNWGIIESVVGAITTGLEVVLGVLSWLLKGAVNFAQVVIDNWSWISPIIYGIATALGFYAIALSISSVIAEISAFASKIHSAALDMETGSTYLATGAQYGFNAALLACPITWIIIAFIAWIAIIYSLVAAIAHFTGIANSGLGVICGVVNVVIQFFKNLGLTVANIAIGIWNAIKAVVDNIKVKFGDTINNIKEKIVSFVSTVVNTVSGIWNMIKAVIHNMETGFKNAISKVQSFFYNLAATAAEVIGNIAKALNELPFIEFDYSGVAGKASEYAAKAAKLSEYNEEYEDISEAFNKGMNTFDTFKDGWISDAFKAGAAWGDGIADKISNFNLSDLFGIDDYENDLGNKMKGLSDLINDGNGINEDGLNNLGGDVKDIKGAVDKSSEEIKSLIELASLEYMQNINQNTIAPVVNVSVAEVKETADMKKIIAALTKEVGESLSITAEGAY